MKVSFDFDSTLSESFVQDLAMLIGCSYELFVTTSRRPIDCNEVYAVSDKLMIPRENVRFTTFEDKYLFLDGFHIHFDDDPYEIDLINRKTKCKGILIGYKDYRTAKVIENENN